MTYIPPNPNGQATMANSSPVVIASDQSSIPVAATLSAETTKVIGTVNQGTSPWVTSNATTSVVGNGTSATAQRVTLANDSTGIIATVGAVTAITNALPAGSNVIGHVITDTGSTTAVTGTVTISGTVTESTLDAALISQEATTSGIKGLTAFGAVTTAAPTYTTAKSDALSLTTGGALRSDITTIAGTAPTTAGFIDIKGADGNVFVRQTTAANLNATVVGTGTFAVQSTPVTQADTFMLGGVNVKEINAVTPLMGNGVTGTGSLRVTVASDNTAFSVNATLSAETTKVIGTTRTLGNAGAIFDGVNTAATAPANGVLGLGIYNSTEPSPTTGQSVGIQLDSKGRQRGVIMDAAGNTRGANVTSTNELVIGGAGTAGSASANVVTVQGVASMTKLLVTPDANSAVNVAQFGGTTVVNGGTAGIQSVGGSTATNVALTENPLNLGAQAVSSENSAVTTARKVQLVADLVGKLIVLPYANPENFVSGAITSAMTSTTSTSLISAPAAGLRNYITQITVSNSHATVGTDIIIQDGSGGTTLYTIPAAPAYGGATVTFPTPLRQPTTATAIYCANVTTGSNTKVSATGYKGA